MTSQAASASDETSFNPLEVAVLEAIAAQYPTHQSELKAQFAIARVIRCHNSGAGFFTYFEVDQQRASPVALPGPIGNLWVDVNGFNSPWSFWSL